MNIFLLILLTKKTFINHDSWIIILMIIWGLCDGKICFQSYADKESLKNLLVAFNCLNLEISKYPEFRFHPGLNLKWGCLLTSAM
jgi:hypothetical protein